MKNQTNIRISIIGAPNAGKSTLMNKLICSKVSITTHKPQTTRNIITGITILDNAQLVFLDTPGIFSKETSSPLEKTMLKSAWGSIGQVDSVIVIVDAKKGISKDIENIISRLDKNLPAILVLNKIDTVLINSLLPITKELNDLHPFQKTFMISALNGDGVLDLKNYLKDISIPGKWLYPEDQISTLPSQFLAQEITREKLFLKYHQEIPYALTVETESWEELKNGDIKISQVILVEREGHKKIIVGKGGTGIKAIGEESRKDIENLLGKKVHLFLFVKVDKYWYKSLLE